MTAAARQRIAFYARCASAQPERLDHLEFLPGEEMQVVSAINRSSSPSGRVSKQRWVRRRCQLTATGV